MENRLSIADLKNARRNLEAFVRQDGWENSVTGLNIANRDHRIAARFRHGRQIGRAEYEAMYVEDPIFARIVDGIPEHATRKWIKITGSTESEDGDTDSDFGKATLDALEDLDAQGQFFELLRLSRLDGGAAMIIGADDGKDPEEPLDLNSIRRIDHLNVLSRFEIFPQELDRDPTSPTYQQPLFYDFTGTASAIAGTTETTSGRIHHSRVIRMLGIRVSESPFRGTATEQSETDLVSDLYWGTPIAQRVYDDLRQYNTIFGYVESGFKDLSQGVMGIKNLAEILSSDCGNEKLIRRMSLIGLAASSFNMVLYDPDFEQYEKRMAQLTGVDGVLIRFMEKLAAASELPLTKLFGMAPAGLSTDDESGERNFNTSIADKQKRLLKEPIGRVVEALLYSKEGPTDGKVPDQWSVSFVPLDEPSEDELAARRKLEAETDSIHIQNGTISEKEARSRLENEPDSPYVFDSDFDEAAEEMETAEPLEQAEAMAEELEPATQPEAAQAPEVDAQKTALNGAQVSSALGIVGQVAAGALPRSSGIAALVQFFNLSPQAAEAIMGEVGTAGFVPTFIPAGMVPFEGGSDGEGGEDQNPESAPGGTGEEESEAPVAEPPEDTEAPA